MAWGATFRAGLGTLAGLFIGLLLAWLMPFFTSMMVEIPGVSGSNMLVRSFTAIGANATTIILVSVIFGLLAGALSDAQFGGA